MMLETLYLRRPPLEYSQAFDRISAWSAAPHQPTLLVLSSPTLATEVLKRWPAPADLASAGAFDAARFVAACQGWAWGPLTAVTLEQAPLATYARLVWAEPEATNAHRVVTQLRQLAAPQAELHVITSSFLRRYLPVWQTLPHPATCPLWPGPTTRLLRGAGWHIKSHLALHGVRASAWGLLRRAAEAVGRPDWGDRCAMAIRVYYCEPGWLWPLAPLALIHARLQ